MANLYSKKVLNFVKNKVKTSSILLLLISLTFIQATNNQISSQNNSAENSNTTLLNTQDNTYNATVYINGTNIIRELPSDLFGSNIQYTDFGDGILNPNDLTIRSKVIEKVKNLGLSTIRFPGGCHADVYHWRDGVGPLVNRTLGINYFTKENETNKYGTDEHVEFCRSVNVEPTITINFGNGTPQEAANWVEYCNGKIPESPDPKWNATSFKGDEKADPDYFAWLRGNFSQKEPYNIKKWEVGNEVYNDWTQRYNSTQYANKFVEFWDEMNATDPTIKIAAVGYDDADAIYNSTSDKNKDKAQWNREVAKIAGSKMDAIHIHMYQPALNDGYSVLYFWNENRTKSFSAAEGGDYQLKILAQAKWQKGPYPFFGYYYANLSIYIDNIFKGNISLDNSTIAKYYFLNFTSLSSGDHNLTIGYLNDYAPGGSGEDLNAVFMGDVELKKGNTKILIQFTNKTQIYDAIMAGPLQIQQEIKQLKKILNETTGRNDIEIWVTEFNIMYQLFGFRLDQALEFKSALSAADMAIQGVYGGADVMQQWSLIEDWYFGLVKDGITCGERNMYRIFSLINEGLGTYLLNSTVDCPKFGLYSQFGTIKPNSNVPYIDVMPTMDGENMYVLMINKHPTQYLDVNTIVTTLNSNYKVTQKTISSYAPDTLSQNPLDNEYTYASGKAGSAIFLNASQPVFHTPFNNFFGEQGSIEFWFKPNWAGNEVKNRTIMSAGQTFSIIKYNVGTLNLLLAYFVSQDGNPLIVAANISAWKANTWQHIAITWNQDNNLEMYINGTSTLTTKFMNNITYIDPQYEIVIGSSLYEKVNGADGYFDEFRISNVSRNPSQLYYNGIYNDPLTVDGNTTILFRFENSIIDSQRDERSHITINSFMINSNSFPIRLPPCSISLIKLEKFTPIPSDDDNGSDKETSVKAFSNIVLIGLGTLIVVTGIVLITIFLKKKKR